MSIIYVIRVRRKGTNKIVVKAYTPTTNYSVSNKLLEPNTTYQATVSSYDVATKAESPETAPVEFTTPGDEHVIRGFEPPPEPPVGEE